MCRLYGFRANEPTKVECPPVHAQNGLLAQSWRDQQGVDHPDGWGIAFYDDDHPEVERRATPAYECLHFSVIAERVYARTVLAHVRRATVGGAEEENTHPFTYGRWTLVHNGTVRGFEALAPQMLEETAPRLRRCIQGATDTEATFYWLLSRMQAAGIEPEGHCADVSRLAELLWGSIRTLDGWSREVGAEKPAQLNFLLTDGDALVATRLRHSLFWELRRGIHPCEVCGVPHVHHTERADYRAVVVASEPISDEPWEEVPEGSVLAVDAGIMPRLYPR